MKSIALTRPNSSYAGKMTSFPPTLPSKNTKAHKNPISTTSIIPVDSTSGKRLRQEPATDKSTVLCPSQIAVPNKKRADKHQTVTIAQCSTYAYEPVASGSSIVIRIQSITERNRPWEVILTSL